MRPGLQVRDFWREKSLFLTIVFCQEIKSKNFSSWTIDRIQKDGGMYILEECIAGVKYIHHRFRNGELL
jgi:hypothetical protein